MLNVLVTGSSGQVGSELKVLSFNYSYNFFFTNKEALDISNLLSINDFIEINSIDIIINCAAYTAVDMADKEMELADKINNKAVHYLAKIAKERAIKLVHISTDYIFDGKNFRPYVESDKPNPINIYGKTKRNGEKAMQEINPCNSIIIRTSWVYSSFGTNFVKNMLRLGKERDSLGVIFDQIGTPTYARDLAKVILDILPQIENKKLEIYNYSNEGVLSWYDFAKEIMKMAKIECKINPIETKEYPSPVKRPYYSLLNKEKIKNKFNIQIPFWKDSLDTCLKVMGERR
ncbi:dTDP-4-dehydrorhamnose reductase [hydrothermal vent metagenome]|uniref:dTDP-4-dehydrorhamnose reductase n=1 Tax=hydrothermal vent metagenome TaxID=652676 RepID=A0A1W1CRH9_9ZZZZ